MSERRRRLLADRGADVALSLGLFVPALLLRLWNITLVPPLWYSEIQETLDAVDIALGRTLPLVLPSQPHLGPVAAYPLALVLRLTGLQPFTPRIFMAVVGALTVVAAYWLARVWAGRLAGFMAGALLAVNPFHIVINSHFMWTNSATPLLVTLALLALTVGVERRGRSIGSARASLVLGGVLFGLALQSHPSVIGLAPGLALWFLASPGGLARLRERWTWLAAAAAGLAYSNIVIYNLANGFRSLEVAGAKTYALPESQVALSQFPERLQALVTELLLLITGRLSGALAFDVPTLVLGVWFILALAFSLRRSRGFFFWTTLSTALIIGYSNKVYNVAYAERYIMFLVPIAYATMGLAAAGAWRALRARTRRPALSALAAVCALGLFGLLLVQPVLVLDEYYRQEMASGRSNEQYLAWSDAAASRAQQGYRVLIGRGLDEEQVVRFGSTFATSLDYLLRMQGIATSFAPVADLERLIAESPETTNILLLERTEYAHLRVRVPLCVLDGRPGRVMALYLGPATPCPR